MTVSGFLRLLTPFALKGSIVRGYRRSIFEISTAPSETRLATHSRDPIHDLSGQVFVGTWQHLPAASHSELARVLSTLSRSPFPLSFTYHRPIPIAFFSSLLFSPAYARPNIADLASLFSLTCLWYRVCARCFLAYFKRYVEARRGILGSRNANERSYAGTCMLILDRDRNE